MMKLIATVLLMTACAGRNAGDSDLELTQEYLLGHWCSADQLCLDVSESIYGQDYLIYNWMSSTCQEGGFIQVMPDGHLEFGALFHDRGCFSRLTASPMYTADVIVNGDGVMLADLSVLEQPLLLTRY